MHIDLYMENKSLGNLWNHEKWLFESIRSAWKLIKDEIIFKICKNLELAKSLHVCICMPLAWKELNVQRTMSGPAPTIKWQSSLMRLRKTSTVIHCNESSRPISLPNLLHPVVNIYFFLFLCPFAHLDLRRDDYVSVYADLDGQCKRGLSAPYEGKTLFVGNGIAQLSRRELFSAAAQNRCKHQFIFPNTQEWEESESWSGGTSTPRSQVILQESLGTKPGISVLRNKV